MLHNTVMSVNGKKHTTFVVKRNITQYNIIYGEAIGKSRLKFTLNTFMEMHTFYLYVHMQTKTKEIYQKRHFCSTVIVLFHENLS